MPDKPHVLAIDSGTQSVRAIVFDRAGNVVARESAPHEPYFSLQPGWSEQHPRDYWDKLRLVLRKLMARPEARPELLAACAITTQRGNVVATDAKGEPLRPSITWLDQRLTPGLPKPRGYGLVKAALDTMNRIQLVRQGRFPGKVVDLLGMLGPMSKFNWIKVNEPDIYARTAKFLTVAGWLTYKLTGRFADSAGMQAGVWPFDGRAQDWYKIELMFELMGCRRDQMAELVRPGEVLGAVTRTAAEETGLPAGLPLVASAGDKQCETLGSGCTGHGTAVLSYGTAAVIGTTARRYMLSPLMEYYTWPSAVPGAWNPEFFLFRGYWLVSWFREQFGYREEEEAHKEGLVTEEVLNRRAADIRPGSDGLVVQPYWTPTSIAPAARGAVVGWTDVHTRAHLYRAILEGIAYALRDGIPLLERDFGTKIKDVRVSGGGAKSDVAMQITADVFGLPAGRPHTVETCALGAAINAAMAAGWYRDADEAAAAMTRTERVFEPIAANVALYEELYQGVHRRLYPALKDIHRTLNKVGG
ncbi:MAG: FGGY-family carbohydrate kinase [Bacillota bacterium]|jgi:sugar (pentulose or hexulose) kinase